MVVIGGGPCGLAAGMLLVEAGLEVTVLEKDSAEPPGTGMEAWDDWLRPGVAQFRQPHSLWPRGREILQNQLPGVFGYLGELGAYEFNMSDPPFPTITDWSPKPGDERFSSMGARRPIYELAFALAAQDTPGLTVRRGQSVVAVATGPEATPGIPHITGVETDAGDQIAADLVIDAAGRRSPLPALLEDVGANRPFEESQDSRFVYYTRYYRRRDSGALPQPHTVSLFPAGSISILTMPGDNDTWQVTLYATTKDKAMRAVKNPDVFERVVRAHSSRARWLDGDPITDVHVMAGISDRERSLVVDGSAVATGIVPVADAWACTNPSLGRGITMGLMHVSALTPSLAQTLDRPSDLLEAWLSITREHLQPWHHATLAIDRARNQEMEAVRKGEAAEPSRLTSSLFDENIPEEAAFFAAAVTDPDVFRALLEVVGLFTHKSEVMARPDLQNRVAAASKTEIPPVDIPPRGELESLLAE